jgi:hypothetical protein
MDYKTPPAAPLMPPDTVTPDATAGIIPYKNVPALLAYYMGVFSLIPFIGFFISIGALVCGIIGLKRKKAHPNAKGSVHAWIGIIAGGIMFIIHSAIVALMIIGIMTAE